MLDRILNWFSVDMGIDLGTCNTLVAVRGEGIILNEPSVVAVKRGTNRVLNNGNAVGWQAKEMLGKTPGSISAIRPLKDGVISDFEITEAMLSYFIRKATGKRVVSPRVVIAVPAASRLLRRGRYSIRRREPVPDGCISSRNRWRLVSVPGCRSSSRRLRWSWISVVVRRRWPSCHWPTSPHVNP